MIMKDYEKRYAEAFAITKIRTFKHEPFFIVGGGGGGGAYSWYFTTCMYSCIHSKYCCIHGVVSFPDQYDAMFIA